MVTVACFSWHPTASEATALAAANYSLTPTTPGTLDSASNADILIVSAAELAEHRAPLEQLLYRTKRPPALLVISRQATNEAVIESPLPFQLLVEPVTSAQLLATLARLAAIQKRYTALGHDVSISSFAGLVSASDKMRAIFESIERVAQFSTTVLIQGESGTGKELVARAIHSCSSRKMQPFIAINCGAIPENLLESELFGHRKGAFTDATRDKKGLFEEADGGTILLDEIGELPVHLQVKLLRVLQEQVIRPIGSAESISVDVRVLAATLRNLELDVEEGKFRDDLYYRLNVIPLTVPSLRERPEDIAVLTQHFLLKHRAKLGLPVYSLSDDALTLLIQYPWPGNIRELENTLERAMILCDGATIVASNLPERIRNFASDVQPSNSLIDSDPDNISIKSQTRHLEISLIKKALEQTSGNRTHAAKLLEISHRTLLYKLKEYGLADDV